MTPTAKRLITSTTAAFLTAGALLASPAAAADDRGWRDGDYRYSQYSQRHNRRLEPLKLKIDYRLNGEARIPLRRLIEREYGIDTSQYDLAAVRVKSKKRRNACAELLVGNRGTGPVFLREGTTVLHAPRHARDGKWTLQVDDARIRRLSVILEPKDRYARYDSPRLRERRDTLDYRRGYRDDSRRYDRWYRDTGRWQDSRARISFRWDG